jgi:hypothetical protein
LFFSRITSFHVGIDFCAPLFETVRAAATRTLFIIFVIFVLESFFNKQKAIKPPIKVSPAAVVSTIFVFFASSHFFSFSSDK